MKIGIATDHGGFELKKYLEKELSSAGHEIINFGNEVLEKDDDYPDFVIPLARSVSSGFVERGIAVCGSGVGACIAANKVSGVRACLVCDTFSAHQGVEDDKMNLICLGGRITGSHLAWEIVRTFISAEFSGEERHSRRISKIKGLESA
ncbi:MAG TPA: RpiB/LacA/LacB family sugar-phosphate isomerase [Bacteroidales bacterium]|nr:RpiB/LacA/LacB family sugar-phosphate isomerase [Bacteroidales bacterium]